MNLSTGDCGEQKSKWLSVFSMYVFYFVKKKRRSGMLNNDFKGRRCAGCGYCAHADHDKMKCYPESEDCKSEYDLTEEDFHTEVRCDFFKSK